MKYIKADIWDFYGKGYYVVVPTNGHVNGSGENPMGRGVALQASKLFNKLDMAIGNQIKKNGNHVYYFERQRLFTFPTKAYWKDNATLELIEQSCKELKKFLDTFSKVKIVMPKVGCGWGKLNWEEVKPLIERYFAEYEEDRVLVVDNEQGDSKEWMGENKENVRDKKEPLKINFVGDNPGEDSDSDTVNLNKP